MTMAGAPDIRLRKVRAGYDGQVVLDDVTALLPAGRVTAILGGSGCGKTTLLRHMLGLERVLAGSIQIGSEEVTKLPSARWLTLRRSMGVLFQDGALLGSLTLGENVALPLKAHTDLDDSTIETLVREKLGLVGLAEFIHYAPARLSGGMRKRAGLARAMVMTPSVLFCDEPTAGLDPITAAEMDQLILDLKQTSPMTIVVVTHDLESVFAIADHVIVIHCGRVLMQGSPEDLKSSRDGYLTRFLGRQDLSRAHVRGFPNRQTSIHPPCAAFAREAGRGILNGQEPTEPGSG